MQPANAMVKAALTDFRNTPIGPAYQGMVAIAFKRLSFARM
jgi:hypothetical protein